MPETTSNLSTQSGDGKSRWVSCGFRQSLNTIARIVDKNVKSGNDPCLLRSCKTLKTLCTNSTIIRYYVRLYYVRRDI